MEQHRVHFFMEGGAFFLLDWDKPLWKVLLHIGCPVGDLLIAPVQPEIDRKAHHPTHVKTGHWVMRQRIAILPMIVVPVDLLEQTPHMLRACREITFTKQEKHDMIK